MEAQIIEQRRQAIITAVERRGITGRQLDPSSNGSAVSKLKQGKRIPDETLDRIYNRLIELLPEFDERDVPSGQGSIAAQQEVQALMTEFNARIKQLENEKEQLKIENERLKAQLAEQLEAQFEPRQLDPQGLMIPGTSLKGSLKYIADVVQKIGDIEGRMEQLEQLNGRIAQLEQHVTHSLLPPRVEQSGQPQEQITQLQEQLIEQPVTEVLGFKLKLKTTSTKKRRYKKWYATKGAEHVVYIGSDPSQAEEKIRAYLEKQAVVSSHGNSITGIHRR